MVVVAVLLSSSCAAGRTTPDEIGFTARDLKETCYAGGMEACDELAAGADAGTQLAGYGATCGGRVRGAGTPCADRFGGVPVPEVELDELDRLPSRGEDLAGDCAFGELAACDELARLDPRGSELPAYGARCGGRTAAPVACVESLRPAALEACEDAESVDACIRDRLPEAESAAELDTVLRAAFADLAHSCFGLALAACDRLAAEASPELYDGYHEFGASCGQRRSPAGVPCGQETALAAAGAAAPPEGVGDEREARLRKLAEECYDERYESCAALAQEPEGTLYDGFRAYGASCGDYEQGARPEECAALVDRVLDPAGAPVQVVAPRKVVPAPEAAPAGLRGRFAAVAAVIEALESQGAGAFELELDPQEPPLKVGRATTFNVTLERPIRVALPVEARGLGGDELLLGATARLQSWSRAAFLSEESKRIPFVLRLADGSLSVAVEGGSVGRFFGTPREAGTQLLSLYLNTLTVEGESVDGEVEVKLEELPVEERSTGDLIGQFLDEHTAKIVAGLIGTLLAGVITFVAREVWRRRHRAGPETPSAPTPS